MMGWWRPLVAMGVLLAALLPFLAARDGSVSVPFLLVALLLGLAPLQLVYLLTAWVPAQRFLDGLRDGGLHVEVQEDALGWLGERTLVLRSPQGEWRVESEGGKHRHLSVRPPGATRAREVRGDKRRAGIAMAERVRLGEPAFPRGVREPAAPAVGPAPDGRYRPGLALVLGAGGVALASGASLMTASGVLGVEAGRVLAGLGAGWAWFVAVITGFSLAYRRWQERQESLGRAGASALMLAGLGAGLLALQAGALLFLLPLGGPWILPVMGGAAGAIAGLSAVTVLAGRFRTVRPLLTFGALLAAAGHVLLPWRILTLVGVLLAALALFQAWNPSPVTFPDPDDDGSTVA